MKINTPAPQQIQQLMGLWKNAFGEYNGFWEMFLETAFSPQRCRCILEGDTITASLCWLDGELAGQKIAYLYAVVTHPAYRGRGLCRRLMADTHSQLAALGYASALLHPAGPTLRRMYETMGYWDCTRICSFTATAGEKKVPLRAIGPEEYASLRREFLPEGSVLQERETLPFLARQAQLYAGTDFLMAAYVEEDTLHAMELLGNKDQAPGIVTALNCRQGEFRSPGEDQPFVMFHGLNENAKVPRYFGLVFD